MQSRENLSALATSTSLDPDGSQVAAVYGAGEPATGSGWLVGGGMVVRPSEGVPPAPQAEPSSATAANAASQSERFNQPITTSFVACHLPRGADGRDRHFGH